MKKALYKQSENKAGASVDTVYLNGKTLLP